MELDDIRRISEKVDRIERGRRVLESDFDDVRELSTELVREAEKNEDLSEAWTSVFEILRERFSELRDLSRLARALSEMTEDHLDDVDRKAAALERKVDDAEDVAESLASDASEINNLAGRDAIFARDVDRASRELRGIAEAVRDFGVHRRIARRVPEATREKKEEEETTREWDDASREMRERANDLQDMIDQLI